MIGIVAIIYVNERGDILENLSTKFKIDQKKLMIFLAMGGLLAYNLTFFIYPLILGVYGSFNDWNPLVGKMNFIGLNNYKQALLSASFKKAIVNTFYFSASVVILRTSLGLIFAVLINQVTRFKTFMRSAYFLPVVMPLVAVAIVWKWIYHPRIGLLNSLLAIFGISGVNWLSNSATAMPAIIFMTVWKDLGYAIVIFIAALLNVPKTVYEAAEIDGANGLNKFFSITVPLVKPTTVFIMITTLIGSFQSFIQIMIMTSGGPAGSTKVLSYLIFEEAFDNMRFGYASSLSTILFIMIIIITYIQFKFLKGDD